MSENQTPEQEQQQVDTSAEDLAREIDEATVPMPDDAPVDEATSAADDLDAALADANAAQQVGDLSLEVAEAKAQALRATAELENFRKRVRREMETEQRFAALPLIGDLLPIVDNLQRAIAASAGNEAAAGVVEGVTMVANQLTATLEKHHCTAIDPVGEPFDPNLHEAIAQHPTPDQEPGRWPTWLKLATASTIASSAQPKSSSPPLHPPNQLPNPDSQSLTTDSRPPTHGYPMPTYDYQCDACDHEFELFQSFSESVKKKCPECGKLKLRRLIGAGGAVMFKGSGFYTTDYRSDSYKKAAEADKKSSEPKSEKKSDSKKSESKSSKTESKPKSE